MVTSGKSLYHIEKLTDLRAELFERGTTMIRSEGKAGDAYPVDSAEHYMLWWLAVAGVEAWPNSFFRAAGLSRRDAPRRKRLDGHYLVSVLRQRAPMARQ